MDWDALCEKERCTCEGFVIEADVGSERVRLGKNHKSQNAING